MRRFVMPRALKALGILFCGAQQQISENLFIVVFVALPKGDIEPKGRD
jgi:hypothetical protein